MEKYIIEKFKGRPVKLILNNSFVLSGIIDLVSDDSILFSTYQKTSLIKFSQISEIHSKDNIKIGGGRDG
jgi:hypothetical protein